MLSSVKFAPGASELRPLGVGTNSWRAQTHAGIRGCTEQVPPDGGARQGHPADWAGQAEVACSSTGRALHC